LRVIQAAILARAAKDDIVCSHDIAATVGDPLDGRLERRILERLDLAAVVANEVVVMVAAYVGGLEAGDAVSEVDALHEPELVHPVERAVHARDSDASAASAHLVVDLLRREAAVLLSEELDHEPPRPSAPPARRA
jgi:hypothetical protein